MDFLENARFLEKLQFLIFFYHLISILENSNYGIEFIDYVISKDWLFEAV